MTTHDLSRWAIFYRKKDGCLSDIYLAFSEDRDPGEALRQAVMAGFMTEDERRNPSTNNIYGRWLNRLGYPEYDGYETMLDTIRDWR